MTVEQLYHPLYLEACEVWQTIEDVCAGGRVVKREGETYLPRLTDQSPDDYANYKRRAVFFNASGRTREALVGMLLRKRPQITVPSQIEQYTADITLSGLSLLNYIRIVAEQAVSTGRSATIIDWSAEEKRPYLSHYRATEVVNWAPIKVKGIYVIGLLTVREDSEELVDGRPQSVEIYREYKWTEDGVTVKKWKKGTTGRPNTRDAKPVDMDDEGEKPLMKNGKPVMWIPGVIHNATHLGTSIGGAPMADICDLNISQYMTSADLENGRHICGLPTPYATGIDNNDKGDLYLGSTKAWTAKNPQAKFGFIEFLGQGLGSLEKAMTEKSDQMAVLGARLLLDQKKDAEAVDTVKMRSISETAALSNISGFMSVTLTQVMQWFLWWDTATMERPTDAGDQVSVIMNDDFIDAPLDSATLTAIVGAFQQNAISFDTMFYQLQKGEIYAPDTTKEQELAAIGQRPPATAPLPPPAPAPGPEDDDDDTPPEE